MPQLNYLKEEACKIILIEGLKIKTALVSVSDKENIASLLKVLKKKTNGKELMETKEILKLKKFLNYRGYEFQDIDKAFSEFSRENL